MVTRSLEASRKFILGKLLYFLSCTQHSSLIVKSFAQLFQKSVYCVYHIFFNRKKFSFAIRFSLWDVADEHVTKIQIQHFNFITYRSVDETERLNKNKYNNTTANLLGSTIRNLPKQVPVVYDNFNLET